MVVAVNAIVSQRGDTILFRGSELPVARARSTSPSRRSPRAACWRCGSSSSLLVFAVWSACVDPDRVLRADPPVRRPLGADRDARQPARAARRRRRRPDGRGRPPARPGRGAGRPRGAGPAPGRRLARPLGRHRRDARAARLRARYPLADAAAPARARRGRRCCAAGLAELLADRLAGSLAGVAGFDAYPRVAIDLDPRTLLLRRRRRSAHRARAAPARSPLRAAEARRVAEPALEIARHSSTATRGRRRWRSPASTCGSSPGEFVVLAGRSGSGKSTLLRAACGLVPHFHGGEIAGRVAVGGRSTRTHRTRPSSATSVGFVAQEPETQVVSTTVRAELELPLELRGAGRGRDRPGGRGDRARARRSSRCSIARPTRSPAASCSGSRSAPRSSPGRRCCSSTSRPRSSTRSPATS